MTTIMLLRSQSMAQERDRSNAISMADVEPDVTVSQGLKPQTRTQEDLLREDLVFK